MTKSIWSTSVYIPETYQGIQMTKKPNVRPVKAGWWNIFRPWTLHGAIVPVLIGGAIAFDTAEINALNIILLILTGIGAALFQSAANILNTYGDFVKGTDTVENETRSPELVTGVMTEKQVLYAGLACLGVVCLIGLVFIWHVGWGIMVYGILGLLGAGMYTLVASYKYHGLGQPVCFLMFGILMPMGTYYILTGEYFSWYVFLLSLPNAFMITGVLAGNEMRDYYEDKAANVGTLIGHMSYENGMRLYLFESSVSFVILAVLLITGVAPLWCALAFITLYDLYLLIVNSRSAPTDKHSSFMLVPMCFKLNWHFGVMLVIGYLIQNQIIPLF